MSNPLSVLTNNSQRSTEPSNGISYTLGDSIADISQKQALPSLSLKYSNPIRPTDGQMAFCDLLHNCQRYTDQIVFMEIYCYELNLHLYIIRIAA